MKYDVLRMSLNHGHTSDLPTPNNGIADLTTVPLEKVDKFSIKDT